MAISVRAKPAARRGRKATGLFKDEQIAGLPGKVIRFFNVFNFIDGGMTMKMWPRSLFFIACFLCLSVPAFGYIAYDVPDSSTGQQTWTGSLGMDFDVLSTITITAMGVFDSGQNGLTGNIYAEVFQINPNGTGTAISSTYKSFTGTQGYSIDGSRFQNLGAPVTLGVGHYSIVSWGYSSSDPNGNLGAGNSVPSTLNTGGGLISFVGESRYSAAGTGGVFPTIIDEGPTNRYYAGTFEYVPLPSTLLLLGSGLVGLLALRRRRQVSKR